MPEKGYIFFTMSAEGKSHLQEENPDWLPKTEGVTCVLLAGPYDGVFTIEAHDLSTLGSIMVDIVANNRGVRTTVCLVATRQADFEKGG